jgi:hypothetical protein
MFEYKVVETKNGKEAEIQMNELAKEGWRVVATSYWLNYKAILIITFERELNR